VFAGWVLEDVLDHLRRSGRATPRRGRAAFRLAGAWATSCACRIAAGEATDARRRDVVLLDAAAHQLRARKFAVACGLLPRLVRQFPRRDALGVDVDLRELFGAPDAWARREPAAPARIAR
jgi:hypothetical protein